MIIGTPSRRDASSICFEVLDCQASGLVEVSEPSGIGSDIVAARVGGDIVGPGRNADLEAVGRERREAEMSVRTDDP